MVSVSLFVHLHAQRKLKCVSGETISKTFKEGLIAEKGKLSLCAVERGGRGGRLNEEAVWWQLNEEADGMVERGGRWHG